MAVHLQILLELDLECGAGQVPLLLARDRNQAKQIERLSRTNGLLAGREMCMQQPFVLHADAFANLLNRSLVARNSSEREHHRQLLIGAWPPIPVLGPQVAVRELLEIQRLPSLEMTFRAIELLQDARLDPQLAERQADKVGNSARDFSERRP